MSRVGNEIARLRTASGLTQKQLAKKTGVAESYIADVEAGRRVLQDALIARITKILGGGIGSEIPDEKEAPTTSNVAGSAARNQAVPTRKPLPAETTVYSTATDGTTDIMTGGKAAWSDAFGQMLKDVPVYDLSMQHQLSKRTMAVVDGKVEGQPKENVFWVEAVDNDMIGYRIQRGDLVFGASTKTVVENGYYLITLRDQNLMRQLKRLPGGMIQVSCHKGAPVRETMPENMLAVIGRLLRVEIGFSPV